MKKQKVYGPNHPIWDDKNNDDFSVKDIPFEKAQKIKINIKEDRKEIAKIIEVNLPLMNKNKRMCLEIADAILCHLMRLI